VGDVMHNVRDEEEHSIWTSTGSLLLTPCPTEF